MKSYLNSVSREARPLLVGVERAYDVGMRLLSLGIDGRLDESTQVVAEPLWLIWGSLTDRVDGPRGGNDGAEDAAAQDMRRAASEWLAVVSDPARRTAYLDRWVYEECGYARTEEGA